MFSAARLKITIWYTVIIMLISVAFSVVIYKMLANEVERFVRAQRFSIERRLRDFPFPVSPVLIIDTDLVNESKHRLVLTLMLLNMGILALAWALGYILAGWTLRPIKLMVDEQNRFISDASHELRTPLTALKTAFEVSLRDKSFDLKGAKNLIKQSVIDVDGLQILSDGMLQLAQYQKTNGGIKFEKVSLQKIVADAANTVRPLAELKKIDIKTDIDEVELEVDWQALKDVLVILLDNAIKYSDLNSEVRLSGKKHDGMGEITVEDQGIGIAEKDISHIYDRFYRADEARSKTTATGFGLGLSIAKRIADTHSWTINVVSKQGVGTKFQLKFSI